MKNFNEDIKQIYQTERFMLVLMIINLVLALALLVYSLSALNPNSAVVKVGYGDIGGYRDGTFVDILMYPLLAVVFGVFHNLIALRVYRKRGAGMTKFFLLTTTALILGGFIVLIRLLMEG